MTRRRRYKRRKNPSVMTWGLIALGVGAVGAVGYFALKPAPKTPGAAGSASGLLAFNPNLISALQPAHRRITIPTASRLR